MKTLRERGSSAEEENIRGICRRVVVVRINNAEDASEQLKRAKEGGSPAMARDGAPAHNEVTLKQVGLESFPLPMIRGVGCVPANRP